MHYAIIEVWCVVVSVLPLVLWDRETPETRERDALSGSGSGLRQTSLRPNHNHTHYTLTHTASAAPRITITHHTLTLKAVQDGEA